MKKTFVVLEQGCEINYKLTKTHKEQFNTEFSDCFRLNWKGDRRDTQADFFKNNLCWSEGRSYLYEQVKGKYDYYFFIDDDISIHTNTKVKAAQQIKNQLEKYKPIHGSINNDNWPNWHDIRTDRVKKMDAFTMIGGDLCTQFFSESFANLMFPTWYHGSNASMWYAQFLARKICPERSLFLNLVRARNTRHVPHQDANTTEVCKSYFKEILISEQYKKEFEKHAYTKGFRHEASVPHNDYLHVTAKDVQKYVTKAL
tara:strand:- start:55 stop:825 length:771 start_codon:yes stop_codon:yes gene_type:complete